MLRLSRLPARVTAPRLPIAGRWRKVWSCTQGH